MKRICLALGFVLSHTALPNMAVKALKYPPLWAGLAGMALHRYSEKDKGNVCLAFAGAYVCTDIGKALGIVPLVMQQGEKKSIACALTLAAVIMGSFFKAFEVKASKRGKAYISGVRSMRWAYCFAIATAFAASWAVDLKVEIPK